MQNELVIGFVLGSHGVRGELKVRSTSGEMEHYRTLSAVVLQKGDGPGTSFRVAGVRGHPDAVILSLEGITDPETARRYKGCEVKVPRESAAPLEDDEYYIADLVGCGLLYSGCRVATVVSVLDSGHLDMLEVETLSAERRTVPFQHHFIGNVDVRKREIELKKDWILE